MPRQSDPTTALAYRRRILTALAVSGTFHGLMFGLWLTAGTSPPQVLPPPLTVYPVTLTLSHVVPAGGGDGAPAPAVETAPATSSPPAPPEAAVQGIPVPSEAPVSDSLLLPLPSAPPPDFAHLTDPNAGTGGTGGGTGGGDGSGTGAGAGIGTSAGPASGPSPAPLVERPARSAVPIRFSEPVYPPQARHDGIRARVRVRVLVDEFGHVTDARIVERVRLGRGDREGVVSGLPYGMDAAALDAARRYQFRPAQADGQRVRSHTTITCSFGV